MLLPGFAEKAKEYSLCFFLGFNIYCSFSGTISTLPGQKANLPKTVVIAGTRNGRTINVSNRTPKAVIIPN